jgi:amino acid transporter
MSTQTMGRFALLLTAMGGIVGSGWLFGPLYAAQIAGPAAIISWILGGFLMLSIALTFAELSSAFPRMGGMIHFGEMSHGKIVSFMIGFMIWLSSVVVAPVETLALLQYAGNYVPHIITKVDGVAMLSGLGIVAAAVLMVIMVFLNQMGAKFFSRSSSSIVIFKLAVPILVVITLFCMDFHPSNFTALGGFAPEGIKGIISALPLGGIVFSFIGYSPAIQMGGEVKNPQRTIPFAIISAVVLCMILYIAIQSAFIGALSPSYITQGWTHLSFAGDGGPFAGILTSLGIIWLVMIIYADAFISPFGTAYIYTAGTGRTTFALGEIDFFPKYFLQLNQKRVPVKAMFLNYFVGLCLFLPFHAWQSMVEFLISCFVIAYCVGPIALYALRKSQPTLTRPFKLPAYSFLSFIAFYVCNLLLFWTGWQTIAHLLAACGIGLLFILLYQVRHQKFNWAAEWKRGYWILVQIAGVGILTYLGSFGGGKNMITFGPDFGVIALFSFVIFYLAAKARKT